MAAGLTDAIDELEMYISSSLQVFAKIIATIRHAPFRTQHWGSRVRTDAHGREVCICTLLPTKLWRSEPLLTILASNQISSRQALATTALAVKTH
jgi:hypothetical protein